MKKVYYLYALLIVGSFFDLQAQEVMVIEMNDNTTRKINVKNVCQITFQTDGSDSSCPVAEAIDLGLPSGTKWASWNIGASKPEEYGDYYAWGVTEAKDFYSQSNYDYYDNYAGYINIGDDIAGTEYDVSQTKWGGLWKMPTLNQMWELTAKCKWDWTNQNGVNGYVVTGPNGASIFLPAAGRYKDNLYLNPGSYGYYWTSIPSSFGTDEMDVAFSLVFYSSYFYYGNDYRRYEGFSIRPVIDPEEPLAVTEGDVIDLGLPSGTKWASRNIGATTPEDYGNYYAWGETETKTEYLPRTYKYAEEGNGEWWDSETGISYTVVQKIGDDIAGTKYDVAYMEWGDSWCLPSPEQIKELCDNCSWFWTTLNGVNGIYFKGANGASIFMPAAGYIFGNEKFDDYSGFYWTSSLTQSRYRAKTLNVFKFDCDESIADCYLGLSVRPVVNTKEQPKDEYPVAEAIDLGLPSGTKWASWNIGASKPEEYGGYYAWGETEEKDYYSKSTHYNSETEEYIHIGDDIAGTEYDVAHLKWGGLWRIPSLDQIIELIDNCTRTWTTQNGVNGTLVTGPNGNSIFLPAAGERWNDALSYEGESGRYWSSSLNTPYEFAAHCLYFSSDDWHWGDNNRGNGLSVRAVCP